LLMVAPETVVGREMAVLMAEPPPPKGF
jgi:hypothetical protein